LVLSIDEVGSVGSIPTGSNPEEEEEAEEDGWKEGGREGESGIGRGRKEAIQGR